MDVKKTLIDAVIDNFRKTVKDKKLPFATDPRYGQTDALRVCDLLREIGKKVGSTGLKEANKVLSDECGRLKVPPDRAKFFYALTNGLVDILEKAGADTGGEGYADEREIDRLDAVAAKVEAVGAEVRAQGEATRAAVEAVGAPVSALVEERRAADARDAAVKEQFKSEAFETWAGGFNFATPGGPETRWAKFVTFCDGESGRAYRPVPSMMGAEDFERRCQNRMRKLRGR